MRRIVRLPHHLHSRPHSAAWIGREWGVTMQELDTLVRAGFAYRPKRKRGGHVARYVVRDIRRPTAEVMRELVKAAEAALRLRAEAGEQAVLAWNWASRPRKVAEDYVNMINVEPLYGEP